MKMKNKNLKRSAVSADGNKVKKQKQVDEFETQNSKNFYKPPTVEELNQLRETEILFNSNLFRLQTEELIKEITIKEKRKREIKTWLENFESFLNTIPEYDTYSLSDFKACVDTTNSSKLKGIVKQICKNIPLSLKTDQDSPIKLLKPTKVHVVGLYPLDATIGPTRKITINVIMPKTCFHVKDYLNARYLVKRAVYLSYIATQFKSNQIANNCELSYSYLYNNELHPVLHITTEQVKKTVFEVVISPEEDTFKLSRLETDKSNLRWSYWASVMNLDVNEDKMVATPWYNSILWHDAGLSARQQTTESTLQGLKGTHAALQLINVWLRQRLLHTLEEQLLLGIAMSLASTGRLHKHQSSYQAVRVLYNHLATGDWENHPLALCTMVGGVGISERVRQQAHQALTLLDQADLNAFQALFMTPMPFTQQYDAIINIFNSPELQNVYEQIPVDNKLDYLSYRYPLLVNKVSEVLRTGLTDRVECIVPKPLNAVNWALGSNSAAPPDLFLSFGIKFHQSNMYRVVDKGPPAYDPLADTFRKFWGDKSELRRFKDGTICEAVYWPTEYIREKRKICKNIIEFILKDKLKLNHLNILYDQVDKILENSSTPIEETNLKVIAEFDEFAKKLRELKLPLSIASVQGISEAFSHSDPYPNNSTLCNESQIVLKENSRSVPAHVASVRCVVQLQQHGAWPSEQEAARALRGALLLDMSRGLERAGLVTRVTQDELLAVSGGLVLRVQLLQPREQSLLVRLRGALGGLHARCPTLGPTAALARRWLRAQLLDLPPTVAELLVAASCVEQRIALPQHGFLRFLCLLAQHPWATEPLIVDLTEELSAEQKDTIGVEFRADRSVFPPLCVVTPWDPRSQLTVLGPGAQHLQRLRLLAKQGLQLVEQHAYSVELFSLAALFKPNLSGYHILIHLDSQLNSRSCERLFYKSKTKNIITDYDSTRPNVVPVVDFNPAELYLQELRDNYDDFAVFFHDIHGGDVIAVLWKPNIMDKIDFKVQNIGGLKLSSEQKLQTNIDALIEDFYILGTGLVKHIEVLKNIDL